MPNRFRVVPLALVAVLAGCGGGSTGPTPPPPPPPPTPVATAVVAPGSATLLPAQTAQLAATTKDASGNQLNGRALTWSSSNAAAATVDNNGLVTGVAAGAATISATSEGKTGSADVTVLAPVASVAVAPNAPTVLVGGTVALTATIKDAGGTPLSGRSVTWTTSAPAVATVDGNGLVTTISPGTATVTAVSEGKSGSAQVTALAPIAAVTLSGNFGPKVGDSYSYTPTLRLADGSVVVRPYAFSIQEVGKGTMTPDGTLVPLQTGTITLVVTVDGTAWTTTAAAYDWQDLSSGGALRVALRSDATITNKFGTSEHPDLVISCTASGYLFVYVSFNNFVTSSGLVAFSFDGGASIVATWDELPPSYDALFHPGLTNVQRRAFATLLATARRWAFAFTEFNSTAKGMLFRVTGLTPLVAPIIAACPSNSQVVDATAIDLDRQEVMRLTGGTGPVAMDVQGRAQGGPQMMRAPVISGLVGPDVETRVMVKGR